MFIRYKAFDDYDNMSVVSEIASFRGISYLIDYEATVIFFDGFEDIYLPMKESQYEELLDIITKAISTNKVLTIEGIVIFDDEHYDEDEDNDYLEKFIKRINDLSYYQFHNSLAYNFKLE